MPIHQRLNIMIFVAGLMVGQTAYAADPLGTINKVGADGIGEATGTVSVSASKAGAVFSVAVRGLPPGPHGMHLHENGACETTTVNGTAVPAGAAGGHWDVDRTGKHEGPNGRGHTGDLPVLAVMKDGAAVVKITAPRITSIDTVRGHALVIHGGGDNFADQPAPLGGGGARIACGVIK